MKYFLALIILFSASAHAEIFNASNSLGFTHHSGIIQVSQKQKKRVIMYSTSSCHYCKQARHYFRSHRIPYLERNIDKSSSALRQFEAMGAYGTPTLLLGKKKMIGFNVARFQKFYK